jgi:hypothetical protein
LKICARQTSACGGERGDECGDDDDGDDDAFDVDDDGGVARWSGVRTFGVVRTFGDLCVPNPRATRPWDCAVSRYDHGGVRQGFYAYRVRVMGV